MSPKILVHCRPPVRPFATPLCALQIFIFKVLHLFACRLLPQLDSWIKVMKDISAHNVFSTAEAYSDKGQLVYSGCSSAARSYPLLARPSHVYHAPNILVLFSPVCLCIWAPGLVDPSTAPDTAGRIGVLKSAEKFPCQSYPHRKFARPKSRATPLLVW